ncbi:MAG: S1C family serine protease [Solirubrobacteraceae bacterium]
MSQVKRASLLGFISALVGGAVVALLLVGFDVVGSDGTKTVVQQAPIAKANAEGTSRGLTARDIYKRDAPGVVYIRAEIVQQTQSPFDFGPTTQRGVATGSGFIIDKQGNILTNAHVVEGASKITVSLGNKETVPARVAGRDVSNDLALVKVDPKGLNLKPLALGDAGSVQVGDPTIAIGNPFGLDRTLTTGVVSALQRKIQAPNGFTISNVIQTDAAINPGNSGGPLLDAAGRVIGINSQIETGGNGNGNVGIGFAVPIDTAKKVLPQLEKGNVERGFLGITGATIKPSMNLAVKQGVIVQSVDPGSGADKAGIQGAESTSPDQPSTGGDIITKVNGKTITGIGQLRSAVANKKPGDKVTLTVLHGGQTKDLTVTLGASPTTVTSDPSGGNNPQPIP